jgi:dihydrofolate reductase
MRQVVAATFLSLDGVMQAPGAPQEDPTGGFTLGGWSASFWDEMMGQVMAENFSTPFDLLLGRKTYDIFAAHWPYAGDDPVAQAFGACTKYVATRSPSRSFDWRNTVALRGDVAAEVARLKAGDGPKLLIQGSSELIQTLLSHGLIDTYQLWMFPAVLGSGKRMFGSGALPAALTLVDSKASSTGVVISTYVPAGELVTGSFALDEPSPAELARRAELAKDD